MDGRQRVWRYTLGTLLGCLLMALIWWLVRTLGGGGSGYGTITVDDPAIRRMAEESARAQARAEARRREARILHTASVPWMRSTDEPEPAAVELAAQPFADRSPDRPLLARLYPARVPPIGKRYSLSNPDPVHLPMAIAPWTVRPSGRPVHLEPARLPPLQRMRDIHAPDEATLTAAGVPWRRESPGEATEADVRPADVPWLAERPADSAEVVVVAAQVPHIRPKPDPARPRPAHVPEAQMPWGRDTAQPLERHVYEAHLPSRLRAMTPGGQ